MIEEMVDQHLEFKDCFWGENGFEELKKYMRLGTDFCKELASILTERADQELNYSKGLNRASLRLQKLSKDFSGTLSDAWLKVAIQFDAEADMHKSLSTTLLEEIIKPLKILSDNQVKFRKPVELRVEKVYKNFQEKRSEDYKYRSRCFQLSKDIEKSMYNLDEAQKGVSGKPPNQKEIQKIESQIVKSKELLEKSEQKYHKACSAVELARQDWQIEMIQSCCQMQAIESDRISALEQLIKKLSIQIGLLSRKVVKIADVYENIKINIADDIALACRKFGTTLGNDQELYMYDIYAENTKNMMNKDRRIYNLTKWNEWLNADIQDQVKAKQGMEKLRNFALENPKFSNSNNEADVEIKLKSVGLMQILFASSQFKVQSALNELLDQPKPATQYTNMITTYDKQGVPTTVLKLESGPVLAKSSAPNAPSPPHSPPVSRLHSAHRSSIVASISSTSSTTTSSLSASQLTSMPTPASVVPPLVSMPVPVSLTYDNKTNTYHFDSNSTTINPNNPTESVSTASTISSVSPAALSSSSSASSCSYSALPAANTNKSSLLLKATTNKSSRDKYLFKGSSVKKSSSHDFEAATDSKPQVTPNNQLIMENYYNNSNNSVSDEDEDDEWDEAPPPPAVPPVSSVYLGECIVQYNFSATHSDELNLQPGDQISILEKREDGWWRGKLNDTVGLFPSTYVRELTNSTTTTSSA